MGSIFSYDSPLMNFLTKIANLMIVNILFIVCSIPVFTFGASSTALYYVVLKILRDEDVSVVQSFFKSFKENFKQATLIWIIIAILYMFFGFDLWTFYKHPDNFPYWIKLIILMFTVILTFVFMHVFPYLSRYKNTTKEVISNSLVIALTHIIKTIFMIAITIFPIVYLVKNYNLFPLVIMLVFAFSAFVNSVWLKGIYDQIDKNYSLLDGEYHDRFEKYENGDDTDEDYEEESDDEQLVDDGAEVD